MVTAHSAHRMNAFLALERGATWFDFGGITYAECPRCHVLVLTNEDAVGEHLDGDAECAFVVTGRERKQPEVKS